MKVKDTRIITIEFSKEDKEVDVFITNNLIKEVFMKNDIKLSNFIDIIKKKIPDNKANKRVKIYVYIFVDNKDNPGVRTEIKYGFGLGKYIADVCSIVIDELNVYFTKVIKVALQTMDAKKLEKVDDLL